MDFKAYDNMSAYENKHGNSGVTGYFVDDSQNHLYVEFNDKVIYRYDRDIIGNQLYQSMIKHAEDGNGLSRLIFRMQPKYHHKTLHTELQDMAKDREVITTAEYAEDMKAEMQINAGR